MSVKINQKEGVTLDIVIPHLVFPQLEKTLRLLRANTPPCFRVILIDQSRNDNSYLQKEGLVDVIVKTKKNLGFAKACNTGLRISDAEYVMLLNDDVFLLSKTWLQDCMTVFRDRADAAAVNLSSHEIPMVVVASLINFLVRLRSSADIGRMRRSIKLNLFLMVSIPNLDVNRYILPDACTRQFLSVRPLKLSVSTPGLHTVSRY